MNYRAALHIFTELGPVLAFFMAGRFFTFFGAVTLFMIAICISCLISWFVEKRLPAIPLISAAFVLTGGALTLWLQNPDVLIFADTLYYVGFVAILGFTLFQKKLVLKTLFNHVFAITDTGWSVLSWRWFWFLLLAAVANELVRIFATPEVWIDYRFYKTIVFAVFATLQFTVSRRYRLPEESSTWGIRTTPLGIEAEK